MTTRQVLRDARVLVENGWCQGSLVRDGDNYCARGAINCAATGYAFRFNDDAQSAVSVFRRMISAGTLAEWNDHPRRTQSEVLAVFDKAIAKLEQEQKP